MHLTRAPILRVGVFPVTCDFLDGWYFQRTEDCPHRAFDGRGESRVYGWRLRELRALWESGRRN